MVPAGGGGCCVGLQMCGAALAWACGCGFSVCLWSGWLLFR